MMGPSAPGGPAIERTELVHRVRDRWVVVRCRAPELVPALVRLFPPFRVPAPPPTDVASVIEIAPRGPGYLMRATGMEPLVAPTATHALDAVEGRLASVLRRAHGDVVHLHAAGAVARGGALLAVGSGGAGKSSIAFGWHCAGLPVLGDDVVLLDHQGRAAPFPRLFKLVPSLLREAGITPETTPGWDAAWPEAWYDPADAGAWGEPAPIALVALVQYAPGAPVSVEPLARREGLAALVGSVLNSGRSAGDAFDLLLGVARAVRFSTVRFGNARAAAEALRRLVP